MQLNKDKMFFAFYFSHHFYEAVYIYISAEANCVQGDSMLQYLIYRY